MHQQPETLPAVVQLSTPIVAQLRLSPPAYAKQSAQGFWAQAEDTAGCLLAPLLVAQLLDPRSEVLDIRLAQLVVRAGKLCQKPRVERPKSLPRARGRVEHCRHKLLVEGRIVSCNGRAGHMPARKIRCSRGFSGR